MIKREKVIPGVKVRVDKLNTSIMLDAHLSAFHNNLGSIIKNDVLEFLSNPRKLQGINLVRVKNLRTEKCGEVFYTDIQKLCSEIV